MQSSLDEMYMFIVSFLLEKNGFFCINNLLGHLVSSCTRLAEIDYICPNIASLFGDNISFGVLIINHSS